MVFIAYESECVCVTEPIIYVPIDKILKNVMLCVSSFHVLPQCGRLYNKMFRSPARARSRPARLGFGRMRQVSNLAFS